MQRAGFHARVDLQHPFQMLHEPWIDLGERTDLFARHPSLQRLKQPVNSVRPRNVQPLAQQRRRHFGRRTPCRARFERANTLAERFLKRAADGHHFAHRLHLCAERRIRAREFLELPLGNLHHHVIDGRLETRWRFLRYVVRNFVQRHAHGQSRRDLGDRKTRGFRRQRRAARDARVHLDHHHAPGRRLHAKLNIRPARLHAHFADNRGGGVAHALIFLVGERLRRSHGNRIPGVDAHGIEILDRADHHEVVADVAHHFELELLPPQHRFLDQGFVHRAGVERQGYGLGKFLVVIGDRAARASQSERRPDHHRIAKLLGEAQRLLNVVDHRRSRHIQPDFAAGVFEPQPVFRHFYGPKRSANQLDAIALENPGLGEFNRQIQPGLSPDGGQQRVWPLARDHLLQHFASERLDIGAVGDFRVRHDRGRVGIHQHDLIAIGAQRFAGLHARIVEFASLPDDNRPGPDDQNFPDVCALWHLTERGSHLVAARRSRFADLLSFIKSRKRRNK